MTIVVPGMPPDIQNLIQQQVLDRIFRDALFPKLLYRSEAVPELWAANLGESKIWTRPGLIAIGTTPLTPGIDPPVGSYLSEQWVATANQYGLSVDTHMPTSAVSLASLFLQNINKLGLNAGETLDTLARNTLYRAYLAGTTVTTAAALLGATQIFVASISGFSEKLLNARPQPVSPLNPLLITFSTVGEPANTVIAAQPTNPAQPFGPGVLTLGAPLTGPVAARDGIFAANRTFGIQSGGGVTVDAIGAADTLALQDVINGVAAMRANNVPPTADGFYHVHVTPEGESQLYQDQQFRQLFQSLPDSAAFQDLAIGQLVGCRFYRNTQNPNTSNSGPLVATGSGGLAAALAAPDIGGEVVNNNAIPLRRALMLGGGALMEPYVDESRYISDAGVTGKIGEFSVTSNGVAVMTERIRLIIRSPLDALQQIVKSSWSWTGDFAVPSDELTGSPARFKRGLVITHA
jgi:hypothetical protein